MKGHATQLRDQLLQTNMHDDVISMVDESMMLGHDLIAPADELDSCAKD